ncbi:MAG: molybdopterin-dependent oxidoreductase [Deferribacteraceae bacterium]|jgi:anaerobic selenocysteine-containing dehydrogenase|nr:molybdopterin-dependent oxidoreductase [Deferribacteraceae bacterium]
MDTTKLKLSRRSFLGASVAAAAGLAIYGCTSNKTQTASPSTAFAIDKDRFGADFYSKDPAYIYGTTNHNCGGRCITKAQMENGRIVRFLTDESATAYDGTAIDTTNRNCTQSRACARCRGYKGRLYHPGRLKYPLKQVKERGDMTGFVRISWQEALTEITERLKAVQAEYGPEAFHSIYACGAIASPFQSGSYTGVFKSQDDDNMAPALRLLGGSTAYTSDYSFHQGSYMGAYGPAYSGMINQNPTANDIAGTNKYLVLWGSNIPTTHNPFAYPWIKGVEDMKKRDAEAKVLFIGPEFSESGLTIADEWIRSRPYTDVALVHGMLHEMIINTVNVDGSLKPEDERWLDLDYLDTMVYGFFDSPEYWISDKGEIALEATEGYRKIEAVPAGKSLSAYIMGNDDRLTKLVYGNSNYIATKFAGSARNIATCSYNDRAGKTVFEYKKAMKTPKTAEWASAITGIPADRIKELAKMYATAGKLDQPIWNEWSGGQLKQAEGCTTLFAIQTLLIATKNWGINGTGIANKRINRVKTDDPNQLTTADVTPSTWADIPAMPQHPMPSVVQWHTAIKFAFGDQLRKNGYKHNIPDWKQGPATGRAYASDGGVKSLITRHLTPGSSAPATYTVDGRTYFDYEGRAENAKPKYAGFRFILNSAGNIPVNQHPNPIDSAAMFKNLPTYGYTNPRLNVDAKDAFYMVCFDNFMSPSARYADYVLPAATAWEQHDFIGIEASGNLYVDKAIDAPGEALPAWDFAREWVKVYAGEEAAKLFTGLNADSSFGDVVRDKFNKNLKTKVGKSWEDFIKKPFSPSKPSTDTPTAPTKSELRMKLDTYLASADKASTPFYAGVVSADHNTIYGFGRDEFAETVSCPHQSARFHV